MLYALNLFKSVPPNLKTFSVTNYNVGLFQLDRFDIPDVYEKNRDTLTPKKHQKRLHDLQSDVVCFQEFFNDDQIEAESMINEMVGLGYSYYYTNPICIPGLYNGFFGVITFSKHPFVHTESIHIEPEPDHNFPSLNRGIITDIRIGTDTVRIINLHLHSMSLRINDSIASGLPNNHQKMIWRKLKNGFQERARQVEIVEKKLQNSKLATIICGDFNDLPSAYVCKKFRNSLKNAHEEAGNGFGFTYNRKPWFIRIDHQFYSQQLDCHQSQVIKRSTLSDHYPLTAKYAFRQN